MGHQINFFLHPADTQALLHRLEVVEDFTIINRRSYDGEPAILKNFDHKLDGHDWLYFDLVRSDDLKRVVLRHVPEQGYWIVDVLDSPVIEFSKCFFDGTILRRGRVYYTSSYYKGGELVSKSEAFLSWAKKIFAATRKGLSRKNSGYIGPSADQWLVNGGRLVDL